MYLLCVFYKKLTYLLSLVVRIPVPTLHYITLVITIYANYNINCPVAYFELNIKHNIQYRTRWDWLG